MHSFTAHQHISALARLRELDARGGDGLDVRLWWDPGSDRVAVTVGDAKPGLELEVPVGDGAAPFEVFRHRFACAVYQGLEPSPAAGAGVAGRSIAREAR
jgi:hypothetical protein